MSKKIMVIHGSPRKESNTRLLSSMAIQAAQSAGADVTEIDSAKLDFKIPGCSGCAKCHQSQAFRCIIDDQLAHTVATFVQYDVIVVATPTYWMSYPAQLKMLVDRMGSMIRFAESGEIQTPLAGKALAILATGEGALDNNITLLEQQWKNVADMMSCHFSSCLFAHIPVAAEIIKNDPAALKKAEEFGRSLV